MIDPESGLTQKPRREANPWTVAFIVLMVTLISFSLIGPFIGLAAAYPFYDGKPLDFIGDIADPLGNEQMKMLLMIVQGCTTLFGLAIIPALFWKALRHKPVKTLFEGPKILPVHFLIIAGITIFFMGINSVFIEWNANIDLPDGAFETWAKDTEDKLAEVTKFLTSFNNVGQYLVGLLVIAVLPAIGEEIAFRGLLQRELFNATDNIHFAIWSSAIFFSALHLQFYGFVPRVLLGAMFGYLYYWSGNNILAPMLAHLINNGIAVTILYLGIDDVAGFESDTPTAMPWYVVAIFTTLCGLLIYEYRRMQSKRGIITNDVSA